MKALSVFAIGGALALVGNYLYKLNNSQHKIVIVTRAQVYKLTVQGLVLKVFYNIKNPTDTTMRMTPPLIALSLNGKQLATSSMQQVDIPAASRDSSGKIIIGSNSETGDISTDVSIPWIGLASIAPELVTKLQDIAKKDKITLKIQTRCTVYTLVGSFPYDQTTTIKV